MINDSNIREVNKHNLSSAKSDSSKSQISESKGDLDDDISQSNTLEALEMLKKDEFEWNLPKARNILLTIYFSIFNESCLFVNFYILKFDSLKHIRIKEQVSLAYF